MKSLTKTSLALIVVAAASWHSASLYATDTEQDKKDVQRVLERYLESVKTADVSLASKIWLQSPDIVAVTPFGRFKGWDSVRNDLCIQDVWSRKVLEKIPAVVFVTQCRHDRVSERLARLSQGLSIRDELPQRRQILAERRNVLCISHIAVAGHERRVGLVLRKRVERVDPALCRRID